MRTLAAIVILLMGVVSNAVGHYEDGRKYGNEPDRDFRDWLDSEEMQEQPRCYWKSIGHVTFVSILEQNLSPIPAEQAHEIYEHVIAPCIWYRVLQPDSDNRLLGCGKRGALQFMVLTEPETINRAGSAIYSVTKDIDDFGERHETYFKELWQCMDGKIMGLDLQNLQ